MDKGIWNGLHLSLELKLKERQGWILRRGLHHNSTDPGELHWSATSEGPAGWVSSGEALVMLWSKAASAESKFKRLKTDSWGTLFLRRWLESPGSACCTARLLQITTICILGWCSPVACPPLRQLLSPGWPVRPGLGSTDKIKEVKEKDRAFALESVFAQGPSCRAVLSWGSPLLPIPRSVRFKNPA